MLHLDNTSEWQYLVQPNNTKCTFTFNCEYRGYYCLLGHYMYQQIANHIYNNIGYYYSHTLTIADALESFSNFKNNCTSLYGTIYELFEDVHVYNIPLPMCNGELVQWIHHQPYHHNRISANKLWLELHKPTTQQQHLYNDIIQRYNIDLNDTLGVCYRGTDKHTEVKIVQHQQWLEQAIQIKQRNKLSRVLLVTDQEQVRDAFCNTLKDECVVIHEMPVTSSDVVMHRSNTVHDKNFFTRYLDASVRLLANTHTLLNHTGNTACAIAMYRGTAENMYQYSECGELLTPELLMQ